MATPLLPADFKEFLKLLNSKEVEYLVIGGYAVGYYGYVRATADMDIWIAPTRVNAAKAVSVIRDFGFDTPELSVELLLTPGNVIRMGVPPFRIELLTTPSGVQFDECYRERVVDKLGDVPVPFISLKHLKINKQAAGRRKDLLDLDNL